MRLRFICFLALAATVGDAQVTVTSLGGTNIWSAPTSWTPNVVPIDSGGDTYNAIIPSGSMRFDLDGLRLLTGLRLDAAAELRIEAGRRLEVLDTSIIGGSINASGAGTQFTSLTSGTYFSSSGTARLSATGGASISLSAPIFENTGFRDELMLSEGPGSNVSLPNLILISDYVTGGANRYIRARNGGAIHLPVLETVNGAPTSSSDRLAFSASSGSQIDFPALTTLSRRTLFQALSTGQIDLPALGLATDSSFEVGSGSQIEAPALSAFNGGAISLDGTGVVHTPQLRDIDGTSITVTGGAFYGVDTESYRNERYWPIIFKSDGVGSLLDLSMIQTFTDTWDSGGTRQILAQNRGILDLSSLSTITGFGTGITFKVDSNADLRLPSLSNVQRSVTFDIDVPLFRLPALATSQGMTIDVGVFSTAELPVLTSFRSGALVIAEGGRVRAPQLTDFAGSQLSLTPARHLEAPLFTNVDGSNLSVSGGRRLEIGAASVTNLTCSASGFGSLLDCRSVQGPALIQATAQDGGVVDFSEADVISVFSNGILVLSGGKAILNQVIVPAGIPIRVDGPASLLLVQDKFDAVVSNRITNKGSIRVGGDFALRDQSQSGSTGIGGRLFMGGAGQLQLLEASSRDDLQGGMRISQLSVGTTGQRSLVKIVDQIDNNGRGPSGRESVFLYGLTGPYEEGLRIRSGSTLILNGYSVYARRAGTIVRINDLLGGLPRIPFDEGFIVATDADVQPVISGTVILSDFTGNPTNFPIDIEISQNGNLVASATGVPLSADGDFMHGFAISPGTYDVSVKASHWLRRRHVPQVIVAPAGASGLTFQLVNGDADGDNEVGIGDYAAISTAFNSGSGDPNWDPSADLNGDESVDIGDFAILSANYGLVGDP